MPNSFTCDVVADDSLEPILGFSDFDIVQNKIINDRKRNNSFLIDIDVLRGYDTQQVSDGFPGDTHGLQQSNKAKTLGRRYFLRERIKM